MSDFMKSQYNDWERPVSRFWACFFSCSIFSLFWSNKMNKTKWSVVLFFGFVALAIFDMLLWDLAELWSFFDFDSLYVGAGIEEIILLLIADILLHWAAMIVLTIYLMFRWTTEYNLENFGYKSRREWETAGSPKRKIINRVVDVGKKKIKDTGSSMVGKIDATADRLLGTSDKTMENIGKYHELMKRGIITETDFERKKTQLLGLDKDSKM